MGTSVFNIYSISVFAVWSFVFTMLFIAVRNNNCVKSSSKTTSKKTQSALLCTDNLNDCISNEGCLSSDKDNSLYDEIYDDINDFRIEYCDNTPFIQDAINNPENPKDINNMEDFDRIFSKCSNIIEDFENIHSIFIKAMPKVTDNDLDAFYNLLYHYSDMFIKLMYLEFNYKYNILKISNYRQAHEDMEIKMNNVMYNFFIKNSSPNITYHERVCSHFPYKLETKIIYDMYIIYNAYVCKSFDLGIIPLYSKYVKHKLNEYIKSTKNTDFNIDVSAHYDDSIEEYSDICLLWQNAHDELLQAPLDNPAFAHLIYVMK